MWVKYESVYKDRFCCMSSILRAGRVIIITINKEWKEQEYVKHTQCPNSSFPPKEEVKR